ncbi:MAG: hypothetical protein EAZ47_07715 [Bacteroidetes bacterium]|nr:MAG: hypothetical protein EAY72_13145 [Bacteroidota bacterium]TAF92993.1 MAG: hypothetical protein EAZ47_07715 [Bacteroidota bacterium]
MITVQRTKLLFASLVCILSLACKKDTFTTKPQLTFESVNTTTLRPRSILTFSIGFTDREGDVEDTLTIRKITRNCAQSTFTARYRVPSFPAVRNTRGTFEISFDYNLGSGLPGLPGPQCPGRNDSSVYQFILKDKAGNVSDTLVSPEIVQTRN